MPGERDVDFPEFYRELFPRLVLDLVMQRAEPEPAKDAVQRAMADAYEAWDTITTNPTGWVRVAAGRYLKRQEEQDRQRVERDTRYQQETSPGVFDGPEQWAEASAEAAAVVRLLAAMPERRRAVVALAFDGWKSSEIAVKLGMTAATVRSHLRHARLELEGAGVWPKGEAS